MSCTKLNQAAPCGYKYSILGILLCISTDKSFTGSNPSWFHRPIFTCVSAQFASLEHEDDGRVPRDILNILPKPVARYQCFLRLFSNGIKGKIILRVFTKIERRGYQKKCSFSSSIRTLCWFGGYWDIFHSN